jgi:hypothetical protein
MLGTDIWQNEDIHTSGEPVVLILNSLEQLSTQNQVYLCELMNSFRDTSGSRRVMFVCTFVETNLHLIHPQLVRKLAVFFVCFFLLRLAQNGCLLTY